MVIWTKPLFMIADVLPIHAHKSHASLVISDASHNLIHAILVYILETSTPIPTIAFVLDTTTCPKHVTSLLA